MSKSLLLAAPLAALLIAPGPAAAQAEKSPTPPPAAQPGQIPQQQPRPPAQMVNIRLDLTISVTEPKGTAPAWSKAIFLHVVDRGAGRIRTGRTASAASANFSDPTTPVLNVDATPEILRDGRIRVSMTFEFRPARGPSDPLEPIHINERVAAILEDGKPLIVSQTVDPSSDRLIRVDLKATTLK